VSSKKERKRLEREHLERQRAEKQLLTTHAVVAGLVITAAAGAFIGWQWGANWQDIVGGAVIGALAFGGLLPFQALREIGGTFARELWGHLLPWMIIALVLVALSVQRGIDL
jgi:hypothetical protein